MRILHFVSMGLLAVVGCADRPEPPMPAARSTLAGRTVALSADEANPEAASGPETPAAPAVDEAGTSTSYSGAELDAKIAALRTSSPAFDKAMREMRHDRPTNPGPPVTIAPQPNADKCRDGEMKEKPSSAPAAEFFESNERREVELTARLVALRASDLETEEEGRERALRAHNADDDGSANEPLPFRY